MEGVMRRMRLVLLVFLASCAFVSPLSAAPDGPDKAGRGREMALEAVALARSGNYAEAVALFQKAYDLSADPMILYNIGQVAARMGDLPKAREALELFVKKEKEPSALSRGRQALKDVMARWPGSLRITTGVQGALVEVDGKPFGRTPLDRVIELAPGPHVVKVFAKGKQPFERRVEVGSSESLDLPVTLKDEPAQIVPAPVVVVKKPPKVVPKPAVAPNDLSGRVDVEARAKASKGLSTTTWVLIGTGAAAVLGGGLAAVLLLRDGGGEGASDVTWTLR
jgi:hypothetical protein